VAPIVSSSSLPSAFTDAQHKLRQWLEDVEQTLLNDKVRLTDSQLIQTKKSIYNDLLEQTFDYEHTLEYLQDTVKEFFTKLTLDSSRRLQEELTNYHDRLYDVKMFLGERLATYNRVDQTLNDFQVRQYY
jgi:hypothetical protein